MKESQQKTEHKIYNTNLHNLRYLHKLNRKLCRVFRLYPYTSPIRVGDTSPFVVFM